MCMEHLDFVRNLAPISLKLTYWEKQNPCYFQDLDQTRLSELTCHQVSNNYIIYYLNPWQFSLNWGFSGGTQKYKVIPEY